MLICNFAIGKKRYFSYTNAIQADVSFAEAYMKRGHLYERTTHTQEAMQDYNMAIQLNPYADIYFDKRARIRILSFDYYGALDDINKAIDLNSENREYVKHQVDGFISVGMYADALKNLESNRHG
jgi:tetratricopeptide (TPR) repeat protein